MTAAVYELADFIPCTPKDDSVTGIYGALRQAGSSDDEPYYDIYKIQEVFPGIGIASMQDRSRKLFLGRVILYKYERAEKKSSIQHM